MILLDVMFLGLNGIEVFWRIRKKDIYLFIIFLIVCDIMLDKVMGLDYGVNDYIIKLFEIEEVLVRVCNSFCYRVIV